MQIKEDLNNLLDKQKSFLKQYEQVVKEFENSDIISQNTELQKEIDKYRKTAEELKKEHEWIVDENQSLKIALKEQVLDEKLNILKISKEKIQTYFEDMSAEYNNSLLALKEDAKSKADRLKNIASKELGEEQAEFNTRINRLYEELHIKINQKKEQFASDKQSILDNLQDEWESLRAQGVSDEVIKQRIRRNDIEIKIGLSWINKIGIFLIIIGMATFLKYGYYNWLAPHMKGFFAFAFGGLFLAAGEWFNRKEKTTFAKGLTGGGIAILYLAVFNAHFIYKIVNLEVALLISVLVTLTAMVLSIYHNSKTIGSFALIGGYLPFFTYAFKFGIDASTIYVAMGYLFILNLLILIISLYKGWGITNYISFALNVPSLIYLSFETPSHVAGISYSILSFAMYLGVTLIYPFKNKISLKIPDVALLALNTFISCVVTYSLFKYAGFNAYQGLLALIFCLIYFGLGQFIGKYMDSEKSTQIIFYLTSLTFAILIIPFQFDIEWLAMGWFIEGSLMIVYGFKNKFKKLELSGWGIYVLCLFAFFMVDIINTASGGAFIKIGHFDLKYLIITLGSIGILFMYLVELSKDAMNKYTLRGKGITVFKYFTLLNTWIYLIYISDKLYTKYVKIDYVGDFFGAMIFVLLTLGLAFAISKIELLKDSVVRGFVIFLYVLADLTCIGFTFGDPVLGQDISSSTPMQYAAYIILIAFNVFVFFNIRSLIISFIRSSSTSLEYYPLIMAIYLLINLTGFIVVQFNLDNLNLAFSLIYLALAFMYIMFGFSKKYIMIRRFGLGLSVFATGKLFIYDLSYLQTVGKIIAYFCFGFTMLGISLIYQKLSSSSDRIKSSIEA